MRKSIRMVGLAALSILVLGGWGQAAPHAQAAGGQGTGAPGAPSTGGPAPGTSGTAGAGGAPGVTATQGTPAGPATSATQGTTGQTPAGQTPAGTPGTTGQTPAGQPGRTAPGTPPQQSGVANSAASRTFFTLGDAIAAAVASSSSIQIAARNVEIDRRRADEAAAAGRPNLNASASATRYDQATKIKFGQGPPIEVQKEHSEILSVDLANRLDLTGQIRAASNQARLQSLADQFVLGQIRNARVLDATTIYFNLLRAQHQVAVAQASLNTAVAQQVIAHRLFINGVGQRIDELRANTQVATARQDLTRARNTQEIARQSFNDLVGRPLTAPVQVQDAPGVTVGLDISGAPVVGAPTPLGSALFQPPLAEVDRINVDQSIQTAYRSRPEILAGEVDVRVAQTGIKLARAGLEPGLSLNATGDYYPTTSFQFPRQRTAAITASVTVPLYDGGATRDRVAEAQLRTQNAQTSLEAQKTDVSLAVRQAYVNLATAAQQIDAANAALQQAIAARQLAQIRYEGQVALYLEVTDAQAALVQAENSQINAVYDFLTARAQFAYAVGTPLTR